MLTYWLLYLGASNVIDEDKGKFLKRNREEKRKISISSSLIKSSSFDRTSTYIDLTHRIEDADISI